jgi:GNAT superfamily N-acetyltransferase
MDTPGELSDIQASSFCSPDHVHGEGFVAVAPSGGGDRVVGHLCLESTGERRLELALAVADAQQGRGIGRALLRTALDWADQRGYQSITACCTADNARVLRLLSSAPHGARVSDADGGVVDVTMPLTSPLPRDWSWIANQRTLRRTLRHPARHPRRGEFHAIWTPR